MFLKVSYKTFLILLAFFFAIGLSYLSIRTALASYYVDQGTLEGYERATRFDPSNPENWRRLGDFWQFDLQHADPQRAIQAYRTALSLNRNSAQAWMGLASAYEGQGKVNAASDALFNAKGVYPKSADVLWRYANFLLRRGELDAAFREARQALENEPQRAWDAVSLFQRFDPDFSNLVDRLIPRHETAYLDVIWGLDREGRASDALQVWDRLYKLDKELPPHRIATGTLQLTQVTLFTLVDQLVSQGYTTEASRVWKEALDFIHFSWQGDPRDSLVWDGGFETDLTDGLAWRIDAPPGSVARFSNTIKHSGTRALEIKFDGKHNVDFHGVCQFVVVEPDTIYDFSAWLRTENITTDRGMFLSLRTPQEKESESVTSELTGTHSWTRVGFRWKASRNVGLLQICLMRLPSHNLYNRIAGMVWLDDVQLVPVKAETGSL